MAAAPSLMDLSQSFPLDYSIKLDCSKKDLPQKIEEVASFVSKVYAKLPNLGAEKKADLRREHVLFELKEPDPLPTALQCEQFEKALKDRIIVDFTEKKRVELSTDYAPEGSLAEVALSVFDSVVPDGYRYISNLFPFKTCTNISMYRGRIWLSMRLQGPVI
jgi:hypothetical protein